VHLNALQSSRIKAIVNRILVYPHNIVLIMMGFYPVPARDRRVGEREEGRPSLLLDEAEKKESR